MNYLQFPKQHWPSIKSTNVIESIFASVKLRTDAVKRIPSRESDLYLVFKLVTAQQQRLTLTREVKYMIIRVYVILLVIIFFVSCADKEPDRYYSKKGDFSIKFPKDWEIKEDYIGSLVMALSPLKNSEDDFRENVNVSIEKLSKDMTVDEYLDFYEKDGKVFYGF